MAKDLPSRADAIHNIQIFMRALAETSLSAVCHISPPDIIHLRDSMKNNFLSLLADLFWTLEVKKVGPDLNEPQDQNNQPSWGECRTCHFMVVAMSKLNYVYADQS